MPELPEVETIRRDLQSVLAGDSAKAFRVFDRRLLPKSFEPQWRSRVLGQVWQSFERRGKYLIVRLANAWRLVFHLRMTGQLVMSRASLSGARARMAFYFASGRALEFRDQRRFGEVWLIGPNDPWPSKQPLGPDILAEVDRNAFVEALKSRSTRIQALLMDQRVFAGVGNIYSQEALFKAAIRPSRPSDRLSRAELARLYDVLRETLENAIAHRGSTSRNYLDAYGRQGQAQRLHAVYRRDGKPCLSCGRSLRAGRVGGRGTVFCSECQR